MQKPFQLVLSLPKACASQFDSLGFRVPERTVVAHDPAGSPLGSGGGMAHALAVAWGASGEPDFAAWARQAVRVVVHAGGESRRTPAYAAEGKAFTPIPVLRWSFGQRLDQTLLDLQMQFIEAALNAAPAGTAAAVCSGDVLLQGRLPRRLPAADVVCVGMWTGPETASRHGVFFCERAAPERLRCMLQKPSPAQIKEHSADAVYLTDTGLWFFSERALMDLMRVCGWEVNGFRGGRAAGLDLYGEVGLSLGNSPRVPHAVWGQWSCAVVPVDDGVFYHFGSTRELVSTTLRLQNALLDQRQFGSGVLRAQPATFIQNAEVGVGLHESNHTVWIENAVVPAGWRLTHSHVLTGIPENAWCLRLPAGVCLDVVPVGDREWVLRFYDIDDAFRGPVGDRRVHWLGRSVEEWFTDRGITFAECGIDPDSDLQHAPIFPVLPSVQAVDGFVQWLIGTNPEVSLPRETDSLINRPVVSTVPHEGVAVPSRDQVAAYARLYRDGRRMSASDIVVGADIARRSRQREALQHRAMERLASNPSRSVFLRTDLSAAADTFARNRLRLPAADSVSSPLEALHLHMFRAAVRRLQGDPGWTSDEVAAFGALRAAFLSAEELAPAAPQRRLLHDQIIWGRSPVRIDLAGGWTDTPPYCLIHGGRVVNLAVELNGQPPVQVFGRCCDEPEIVIRSIDLGAEERIRSYDDLRSFVHVGSAFSIPKAALALAGFLPEYASQRSSSLRQALERFGGGIELNLLAAVPKGSGLGTSSILAATVLGTLSELCGLGWHHDDLIRRTLCLEQMLTTGGGWQDQAGGVTPGLKLLESAPGSPQRIQVRWLPDGVIRQNANNIVLLYYTGITRVAKHILQDVVRGMFLNARETGRLLTLIGDNALLAADAVQRQDLGELGAAIRCSWELNCALDAGTNPPAIRELLARLNPWLAGAKLLGAGGGGYLVMVANDVDAASRIRHELTVRPANSAARFVDMSVSDGGLQITRS